MTAIKTQGTQLYVIDPNASGGAEILAINCTTALSGLGAAREQIEVTCLEDVARQYVGGLTTPEALNVTVNYDPNDDSHFTLYELWKSNTDFKLAVAFGPETTAPTLDSAGTDFDFPTDRTFIEAAGYVANLPLEANLNSVWTATIPIQLSGEFTVFPKVVA